MTTVPFATVRGMMLSRKAVILVLYCLLGVSPISLAMPPAPSVVDFYRQQNRLDELSGKLRDMHARGIDQAAPGRPMVSAKALAEGDTARIRVLVILVDFSDNPASGGVVRDKTSADFRELLFSRNTTDFGSLTDFYLENSYGNLIIEGDVYGWYRLPRTYAEYRGDGYGLQSTVPNARTMVSDALTLVDPGVDFSQYDADGDGFVDGVFVVHAGPGAEEIPPPGDSLHIWSHAWWLTTTYVSGEGTKVRNYTTEPEELFTGMVRIGVFCHEFGHSLGLPDLYDVSYESAGIGDWGLMGGGSWNYGGRSPAHFGAWSKYMLDKLYGLFGQTVDLTQNTTGIILDPSASDSVRYRITLPTPGGAEYFLVENRQQVGFDKGLPGHGLLIWHCDDNLSGSNDLETQDHLRIAVEQADGLFQLESGANEGDAFDPYPGALGLAREFTDINSPSNASYYNDETSQIAVWSIDEDEQTRTISCNVDLTYSRPNIKVLDLSFSDAAYGNGDGDFLPGETIEARFELESLWKDPSQIVVRLDAATPDVTFTMNRVEFPSMTSGQTYTNDSEPMLFELAPDIVPVKEPFHLLITTATSADTFTTVKSVNLGGVDVLLVDDDGSYAGSSRPDRSSYYTKALDNLQIPYQYWNVVNKGTPAPAEFSYQQIIWYTGDKGTNALSGEEVDFLTGYLEQSGHLFLTGQDIAEGLSTSSDSVFLRDFLKTRYQQSIVTLEVHGVAGNPVGDELQMSVLGSDGAGNQLSMDILDPTSVAAVAFNYGDVALPAAINYVDPSGSRLVFFGFGFEGVRSNWYGFNTRQEVMRRVIDYLRGNTATSAADGEEIALPFGFQLEQNYPNPFNPVTVISFNIGPDMAGKRISLDVYNILGQKVANLLSGKAAAGWQRIEFDGGKYSSGVYLYRLQVADRADVKKMLLMR